MVRGMFPFSPSFLLLLLSFSSFSLGDRCIEGWERRDRLPPLFSLPPHNNGMVGLLAWDNIVTMNVLPLFSLFSSEQCQSQ